MRKSLSFLVCIGMAITLWSQWSDETISRNFRHFDLEDGLPDLAVNAVAQDTFGFIWIGTSRGIAKSDGQTVWRIYPDRTDSNAMALSVNCLTRDGNTIWAGTDQGLWEIDIMADRIRRHDVSSEGKPPALILNDILVARSTGQLWLAFYRLDDKTHGGIVRYDPQEKTSHFYPSKGSAGRLNCILQDPENEDTVWLGGYSFYSFSKSSGQLTEIVWPELPQYLSFCLDIEPVGSDTLLLATSRWGIVPYSRKRNTYLEPIAFNGKPSNSKWTQNILPLGKDQYFVSMIARPPRIMDLETQSTRIFSDAWDKGDFRTPGASNGAYNLSNDCIGIATDEGFYILNPKLQYFNSPRNLSMQKIAEAEHVLKEPIFDTIRDRVIVPTTGKPGVVVMDPSCASVDTVITNITGRSTPAYGWEATLLDDSTYAVMNRYLVFALDAQDLGSEVVIHHSEMPKGLYFNNILCDRNGLVWSASKDNYFMTWDRGTTTREMHRIDPLKGVDSVHNDLIYEFSQLDDNFIFAACISGLYRIDVVTKHPVATEKIAKEWALPPGVRAHSIQGINDSLMAIGTTSGLYILNNNAQSIVPVGDYNERNNTISEVTRDNKGRIWGISQRGVIVYDSRTGFYRRFTPADGLEAFDLSSRQIQADSAGNVYLVYRHGIAKFNATEACGADDRPNIRFTGFSTNGKALSLEKNINTTGRLELEPGQDYIQINFTNIDLGSGRETFYEYNLSRFGDDWQAIGSVPSVTFAQLDPGQYTLQVRASYDNVHWTTAEKELTWVLAAPFYMRWWFVTLVILLLLLSIFRIYRWRVALLKEQEAVEARAAKAEMQALRSQMNPHFIFNSLNSIKSFIANNDQRKAADYLSKFSKLMRLILNNSKKQWVTLEEELRALELYVELESIRLDGKIDHSITIADNIESHYIEVPPLILQPYVENAIWHGLRHKQQRGHLLISIEKCGDEVLCIIEDDGVGRQASAALNSKKTRSHKSIGTANTEERIARYYEGRGKARVEIEDLIGADGTPAGTRVTITFPTN